MASTMSWQTTGPLVGTPLTYQGVAGVVTHYSPSCAESRRPELWKWNDSVVLIKDNISNGAAVAVASSKVHHSVIQERLDTVVEHFLQRDVLPMCVLLAVMEESWSAFLSTAAHAGTTNSSADRPLYYTTTSIPPTDEPTGCSVSDILARIKAGFVLAHQYHEAHASYLHQRDNSNHAFHRRSSRGPPPIPPTKPLVWQRGGRVALFLLHHSVTDSAKASVAPTATDEAPEQGPTQNKTPATKKEQQRTKQPASTDSNGVELIDAFAQTESSEENDDNDDDDEEFNAPSEDEDDDELHGAVHERVELSHDPYDTEEEPADDDDDDSTDYVLANPHLQPTTILSYLGKRTKTLSMADLLGAIHASRAKWTVRDEDDLFIKDAELRLETTTKYTKAEALQCKYLLVPVEAQLPSQHTDTSSAKQWAVWRFKGIYSGHAVWPSWSEYVNEWRRQQPPPPVMAPKIMVEEELLSIPDDTRRSGRRSTATATTGVYYGVQSSISQKQLLETVVRLCGQVSWHTMQSLEALVGDDALTRLMTAVTTLVYKRRQVLLLPVNSIGSDEGVWGYGLLVRGLEEEEIAAEEGTPEDVEIPPVVKEGRAKDNVPTEDAKPPAAEETKERHDESNPAQNDDNGDTKLALRRIGTIASYLHSLHQTELQLRYLILTHLRSIASVATAADERSMEELIDPTWLTTGHEYIGKEIFRPGVNTGSNCMWWKIQDYCPAVPLEEPQDEDFLVARRAKFRAVSSETIILTEGQVEAGIQAAEMERRSDSTGHPLAGGAGNKMTFRPNGDGDDLHCTMAGHSTVVTDEGQLDYRVLVMPDSKVKTTVAVWLSIKTEADGSLTCMPVSGSTATTYTLLQSDYDQGSPAFEACRTMIEYLKRHPRAEIFMNPVDPVALGIPTYFTIVKRPMDISTLEANLEKGLYSKIVTASGKTAVARMLNGPFKDDALLIFDNAILFNPPDDWIHLTAASIRKALLKKLEQAAYDADNHPRRGGNKQQYVDLDSDVDMYEDEDDKDMPRRKQRVDVPSGAMMVPLRLQNLLTEPLRGPFARLPILSDPSAFSLTPDWSCRHKMSEELPPDMKRRQEILELQRLVEEEEKSSVRRSVRSSNAPEDGRALKKKGLTLQYYRTSDTLPPLPDEDGVLTFTATSRKKVEGKLEMAHETYYAKLYKLLSKKLFSETGYGIYANDSFPPYLGRVVPNNRTNDCVWEIRSTYVVPAIRWVLRGLIQSGHFTAMESMSAMEGGVIFPNDVFYVDKSVPSFGVMAEGKKKKRENADEESEEEIELSTYEQMRAERVARNAERLKALGLG